MNLPNSLDRVKDELRDEMDEILLANIGDDYQDFSEYKEEMEDFTFSSIFH